MKKIQIDFYSTGMKQVIDTEFKISSNANINTLTFENDQFTFKIILTDMVDVDELLHVLLKKKKKTEILCNLDLSGKTYKGKRKIRWRKNNVMVSQGGARLEFSGEDVQMLIEVLKYIKTKH